MMKPLDAFLIVVFTVATVIFGIWIGGGLALIKCVDAGQSGYKHRLIDSKYTIHCEARE